MTGRTERSDSMGTNTASSDISPSLYASLLGDMAPAQAGGGMAQLVRDVQQAPAPSKPGRQIHMPSASSYGGMDRLVDSSTPQRAASAEREQNLTGLTRRLAEMFEQKQELIAELKSERMKTEQVTAERDELQGLYDTQQLDLEQAIAQVEQTRAAREQATKFMDEAKAATMNVISESRAKINAAEAAQLEAERAYEDEHNLRRSLEQLLQEMQEQCSEQERKNGELRSSLSEASRGRDDASKQLAAAKNDIVTLQAESEAYSSRIEHLTGRNELLARNLQSVTAENNNLRRQLDETSVSHASLSSDYEALMQRCEDAENERNQLQQELLDVSTQAAEQAAALAKAYDPVASVSQADMRELGEARSVIAMLRPLIDKANAGALRKGDLRRLDEALSKYEASTSMPSGGYDGFEQYEPQPQQQQYTPETFETAPYDMPQETAYDTADDFGYAEMDSLPDLPEEIDEENSVSFIGMFGRNGSNAEAADAETVDSEEAIDADGESQWTDMEGEFDDLDEPDFYGEDGNTDELDLSDFGVGDLLDDIPSYEPLPDNETQASGSDFAFPEDLKRAEESTETIASDLGIDLSDFNNIMSGFAHYNEDFS